MVEFCLVRCFFNRDLWLRNWYASEEITFKLEMHGRAQRDLPVLELLAPPGEYSWMIDNFRSWCDVLVWISYFGPKVVWSFSCIHQVAPTVQELKTRIWTHANISRWWYIKTVRRLCWNCRYILSTYIVVDRTRHRWACFCVCTAMGSTLSLGQMTAHSLFGKKRPQILYVFCGEMTQLWTVWNHILLCVCWLPVELIHTSASGALFQTWADCSLFVTITNYDCWSSYFLLLF